MLDLVWKDIVQGRKMLAFYLAVGAVIGIGLAFALENVGAVIALQMTVSAYGFAIRSTYDEDKNGALLFLKGLPLSDAAIVASKFLSTLAVAIGFAVFFGGVAAIGQGIIGPRSGLGMSGAPGGGTDAGALLEPLISVATLFGVLMVILGVYLAMFFWLGYARAAAYNRVVMLGVFAAVMAGSTVLQRLNVQPPAWIGGLEHSLRVPSLVAAAGLVIYALSCAVSIASVRARDWS